MERITWFCRDNFSPLLHKGDGTIKLIFSKRKNMSFNDLKNYLSRLFYLSDYQDIRINWNYLKANQIITLGASQNMGLQVADAIASSAFNALNETDYGYTEDKYISILRPTMYSYKNKIWGYGFKVWPEGKNNNSTSKIFQWLNVQKTGPESLVPTHIALPS